jgi:hypothetical protein
MPITTLLPFGSQTEEFLLGFPGTQDSSGNFLGSTINTSGFVRGGRVDVPFWGPSLPGSTDTTIYTRRDNVLCAEFQAISRRAVFPTCQMMTGDAGTYASGIVMPQQYRYFRHDAWLAAGAAVIDELVCFQYSPATLFLPSFTALTQPAWGFIGSSGAGSGWRYVSSIVGPFPGNIEESITISTSVIPDLEAWNLFRFEMFNSSDSRGVASCTMSVNGQVIVSRNWSTGAVTLPRYGSLGAGGLGSKFIGAFSATGANLFVGPSVIQMGKFTAAGLELQD